MHNVFKVYPERPISGILPNAQRIVEPMRLELNESEFIRCMNYGNVFAVVNGEEIKISKLDYKSALKLFMPDKKNLISNEKEKDKLDIESDIDIKESIEEAKETINEELNSLADSVNEEIIDEEKEDNEQEQVEIQDKDKNKSQPEHTNNQMNKNQSSSNHKHNKGSRRR